ncbi:Hypothetical protein SMAX5B_000127 [Scophthalmus maximus]|uniref:Uncharacterized protein n=1 Tax=Scophthalmus maximus TaxID=52904 RepID=A0A2U9CWJ1_SCOMX|nr:Hypothetical protein SMAX5B_000127 [Scophthalmus maximus]
MVWNETPDGKERGQRSRRVPPTEPTHDKSEVVHRACVRFPWNSNDGGQSTYAVCVCVCLLRGALPIVVVVMLSRSSVAERSQHLRGD